MGKDGEGGGVMNATSPFRNRQQQQQQQRLSQTASGIRSPVGTPPT